MNVSLMDKIGTVPTCFNIFIFVVMIKPSYIPARQGTHAGEDVAVFATGPQSHLFSGTMEQNVIPHLMAYAMCIGKGRTFCNNSYYFEKKT